MIAPMALAKSNLNMNLIERIFGPTYRVDSVEYSDHYDVYTVKAGGGTWFIAPREDGSCPYGVGDGFNPDDENQFLPHEHYEQKAQEWLDQQPQETKDAFEYAAEPDADKRMQIWLRQRRDKGTASRWDSLFLHLIETRPDLNIEEVSKLYNKSRKAAYLRDEEEKLRDEVTNLFEAASEKTTGGVLPDEIAQLRERFVNTLVNAYWEQIELDKMPPQRRN